MKIILVFLVTFLVSLPERSNAYTEESINLLVRTESTRPFRRFCIELAKLPNDRTINITNFDWYQPYFVDRAVNACNIVDLQTNLSSSLPPKTMIVLYDSQCKITEHAWNVQQLFGENIALMIITKRTNTRYVLTLNSSAMPVTIPTLVFWQNDFDRLNRSFSQEKNLEFSIDFPPVLARKFRVANLLMFVLVFFVLLAGNFWAADEFKHRVREHHARDIAESSSSSPVVIEQNSTKTGEPKEPAVIPMTYCLIVFLLIFAVGWLLLIYYFPKVMIYILQVMFCIGAFSSLSSCLDRLSKFFPFFRRFHTPTHQCHQPCHCQLGSINVSTLISMAVALTIVIIWYVYRHEHWSWILQDILGAAVCIAITSIYRLGNMRVITLILLGFFLYDIFFVFITPYIPIFQSSSPASPSNSTGSISGSSSSSTIAHSTNSKPSRTPSVMEQVALGFGTNGEVVPLLFALPLFLPESELDPCLSERKSMLGFGDIILPGILLTFCKLFDIASENRWPIYYVQSVISYFIGLSLTHVALTLMNTAQPALLYLVPCLLLSTIITGLCRGELKELYTGRRIQLLLEGKAQRSSRSLLQGIDNPQTSQIRDDTIVNINDDSKS